MRGRLGSSPLRADGDRLPLAPFIVIFRSTEKGLRYPIRIMPVGLEGGGLPRRGMHETDKGIVRRHLTHAGHIRNHQVVFNSIASAPLWTTPGECTRRQ